MSTEIEEIQVGTYVAHNGYGLPNQDDKPAAEHWLDLIHSHRATVAMLTRPAGNGSGMAISITFSTLGAGMLGAAASAAGAALGGIGGAALGSIVGCVMGAMAALKLSLQRSRGVEFVPAQSVQRDNAATLSELDRPSLRKTLAERLAWVREQMKTSIAELSRQSGIPGTVLAQLEHGFGPVPAPGAIDQLADSLQVTRAFLLGDVPGPPYDEETSMSVGGQAWTIGRRFVHYFNALNISDRDKLLMGSVEQRFSAVVRFLCDTYPSRFTKAVIAYQLGLRLQALEAIVTEGAGVSPYILEQTSNVTGIPMSFFCTGELAEPSMLVSVSPAQALQYAGAISAAVNQDFKPSDLTELIHRTTGPT